MTAETDMDDVSASEHVQHAKRHIEAAHEKTPETGDEARDKVTDSILTDLQSTLNELSVNLEVIEEINNE